MHLAMKIIETPVILISQPIGDFYIGRVKASELHGAVYINRKSENEHGIQRDLMSGRLKEIKEYCSDVDATFPTSIILSIDTSREGVECTIKDNHMRLIFMDIFGSVIDGQHRLEGIWKSGKANLFELPVVFTIDPTVEDEAYIFSIINSTQRKVDPSLIYDLFDVSSKRSPKKTVHDIARAFNGKVGSPFYNRLKMLGKKTSNQADATLSQGSFGKRILRLITKNADEDARMIKRGEHLKPDTRCIFREYFIADKDDVIMKILLNCFSALKTIFPNEWENPHNNILWKTTGFHAVIDSLPDIYKYGISKKDLTESMFEGVFRKFKESISRKQLSLTSDNFGSGETETKKLKEEICSVIDMPDNSSI